MISLDTLVFVGLGIFGFYAIRYFSVGSESTVRLWFIASFSKLKSLKLRYLLIQYEIQLSNFYIAPLGINPIAKTVSDCLVRVTNSFTC